MNYRAICSTSRRFNHIIPLLDRKSNCQIQILFDFFSGTLDEYTANFESENQGIEVILESLDASLTDRSQIEDESQVRLRNLIDAVSDIRTDCLIQRFDMISGCIFSAAMYFRSKEIKILAHIKT
ncbi:hypothetical protein RF11_00876 [Thelohanellus kitauei]|uniref:Uncharacterized protein n=1 Tax=Thelohanellus kitauei TaxID=669202 RepID=A0A0C2NA34_THEKT|nr:hypothetical protein RF11_00876 [Thelohanellus kitauei]